MEEVYITAINYAFVKNDLINVAYGIPPIESEMEGSGAKFVVQFTITTDLVSKRMLTIKYKTTTTQCLKASVTINWFSRSDFYQGLIKQACPRIGNILSGNDIFNDYKTIPGEEWQLLYQADIANAMSINAIYLMIECQFSVRKKLELPRHPVARLSADLEMLLVSDLFADVIVKSIDNKEHKAHKAILGSRSTVLKDLLEQTKSESSVIAIEAPFESVVIQEVLNHIYSGKTANLDVLADKLLTAADYYNMYDLKFLSEKVLGNKLNTENCIEILELAEKHSALKLKRQTLAFINRSPGEQIVKTKAWRNFKSVGLIKDMYESLRQ